MVMRRRMVMSCELCKWSPARISCESDQARLCWGCDAAVHGANFLVARHSRCLLCRRCQSPTPWCASGSRLSPTTFSLCKKCVGEKAAEESGENEIGDEAIEIETGDEDDDDEEEEEEEEGEEDDTRVVPGRSLTPPPPATSSSSSEEDSWLSNEESTDAQSPSFLKRKTIADLGHGTIIQEVDTGGGGGGGDGSGGNASRE
ncbi:B-box domain protein 31-like protein [Drosera capensis]